LPGVAANTDPDLVNPWGVSFGPNSFFWVSDNHSGVATIYDGTGAKVPFTVTIPPPLGASGPAAPTGQVFNGSDDFVVTSGGNSGPAFFIFATEDGTISGWNPNVDGTHAVLAVDNSSSNAVYKGLAIGTSGGQHFLYATDFHNGRIDVFDSSFNPV